MSQSIAGQESSPVHVTIVCAAVLLPKLHRVREQCDQLIEDPGASTLEQQRWLGQLHKLMLSVRELGNEKLELTSHMLDTVSVGGGSCKHGTAVMCSG